MQTVTGLGTGQCLLRDPTGRLGLVDIASPHDPDILAALSTTPAQTSMPTGPWPSLNGSHRAHDLRREGTGHDATTRSASSICDPSSPEPRLLGVLTLMVAFGVGSATPVSAQVHDKPEQRQEAQPRLGDDLHPPTSYSTDVDDGIVPIGNYDIGCANDGFIVDVGYAVLGTATSTFFSIGSAIVAVSVWLLEAATSFTLEDALSDTATTIADLLDTRILGPMRVAHLGLVVSALYMGWQFLRGRIGVGAGDTPSPSPCSPY